MIKKYDYIICGAGLSGLILSHKIINDRYFDNKSVLIIDKDLSHRDHKTWCFWEEKESIWNDYVVKAWSNICFKSTNIVKETHLENITYKMIKSVFFFESIINKIKNEKNFTIIEDEIVEIKESIVVKVKTKSNEFESDFIFNSLFDLNTLKSSYPLLIQHFKGWTIKTKNKYFDDKKATIMDFSIDQKNETRFFYILPVSSNEALIEYTLFSKKELSDFEYDQEISNYLKDKGISDYKITSNEKGVIPMTCFDYSKYNTKNLINIGTSGGWTKPSTGYTFKFIDKKSSQLLIFMEKNDDFRKFNKKTRFWYYDRIFLDVLYYQNHLGSHLFERLFKNNKIEKIFKFLDNESSLIDDLKITLSFPKFLFTKTFFKTLLKY